MRILMISQFYSPEPVYLPSGLAESLVSYGHKVTVVTGFPNYPYGRIYSGYRLGVAFKEKRNGVNVVRFFLVPYHGRLRWARAANVLSFVASSTVLSKWFVEKPDLIFVCSPITTAVPALYLNWLWKVPYIVQVQDVWPETLVATGMIRMSVIRGGLSRLAMTVYAKAAQVLVISEKMKERLLEAGVPPAKVKVVPNWVELDIFTGYQRDDRFAKSLGLKGSFRLFYAGNIGLAQGLENAIDAAQLLEDMDDVEFVFVGDGVACDRLKAMVSARALKNVRFISRWPLEAMGRMLALADVGLVHLRGDPVFETVVPHKVLAYFAAGKPVLVAARGAVAEIVETLGAGVACPPDDPRALAKAVLLMRQMPAEKREEMGARGRAWVVSHYGRTAITSLIHELICEAAGRVSRVA